MTQFKFGDVLVLNPDFDILPPNQAFFEPHFEGVISKVYEQNGSFFVNFADMKGAMAATRNYGWSIDRFKLKTEASKVKVGDRVRVIREWSNVEESPSFDGKIGTVVSVISDDSLRPYPYRVRFSEKVVRETKPDWNDPDVAKAVNSGILIHSVESLDEPETEVKASDDESISKTELLEFLLNTEPEDSLSLELRQQLMNRFGLTPPKKLVRMTVTTAVDYNTKVKECDDFSILNAAHNDPDAVIVVEEI